MRTTQYIGLTADALKYVDTSLSHSSYQMTEGMFGEPVMGSIWELPPPPGPNTKTIVKEIIQDVPWSSGPMIFTCLELTIVKECGQHLPPFRIYEWVRNPALDAEYDSERGHYNV